MHPVYDLDALLLLAVALSSKRRAAPLEEIVAAIDLIHGNIPTEIKLADTFARLGRHGLLCLADDGVALTPAAQALVSDLPKKAEHAERLFIVKNNLAGWPTTAAGEPVEIAAADIATAIRAHRSAASGAGKNLLVPKPKPADSDRQRPGQRQRRAPPPRRRKG